MRGLALNAVALASDTSRTGDARVPLNQICRTDVRVVAQFKASLASAHARPPRSQAARVSCLGLADATPLDTQRDVTQDATHATIAARDTTKRD